MVTKQIDGKLRELMERLTVDVPEEHVGVRTSLLEHRKADRADGEPRHRLVRMEHVVPARNSSASEPGSLTDTTRGIGDGAPELRRIRDLGSENPLKPVGPGRWLLDRNGCCDGVRIVHERRNARYSGRNRRSTEEWSSVDELPAGTTCIIVSSLLLLLLLLLVSVAEEPATSDRQQSGARRKAPALPRLDGALSKRWNSRRLTEVSKVVPGAVRFARPSDAHDRASPAPKTRSQREVGS